MKKRSPTDRLKGAVKRVFGSSKRKQYRDTHPLEYCKQYFLPEDCCIGIAFVADLERCTGRKAAVKLMREGISIYITDLVNKQMELDRQARERNQQPPRTRFRFMVHKYLRKKGINITKYY